MTEGGRLLPPGGRQVEEWRVQYRDGWTGSTGWHTYVGTTAKRMEAAFAEEAELGRAVVAIERRYVTTWPDGSYFQTPWLPIDAGEAS